MATLDPRVSLMVLGLLISSTVARVLPELDVDRRSNSSSIRATLGSVTPVFSMFNSTDKTAYDIRNLTSEGLEGWGFRMRDLPYANVPIDKLSAFMSSITLMVNLFNDRSFDF